MLTVAEAARRLGKDPETVRRWIRAGRLRSKRVGTRYVVDEADLLAFTSEGNPLPRPRGWHKTRSGRPMPNSVALIRELRGAR